jgi:pimeloyl-ACP methyl ester carboxylesterase
MSHQGVHRDDDQAEPWPLSAWPAVPTRVLVARGDRLFPIDFQRRVVQARLGIVPDEIDGGHLVALSRPAEVADRLLTYAAEHAAASPGMAGS